MLKKLFSIALMILCFVSIVSCKKEKDIKITSVNVDSTTVPSEILSNEVDTEIIKIKLNVKYSNDSTEQVNISKDMISSTDYAKLSTEGTYTVTVSYKGFNASLSLTIVEPVNNNYTVKVVYPDGTAVNGGVSVQWCSTYCLLPVVVNSQGIAENEIDDDTYYVHIDNIPQGYTYDPNAYVATPDNKHIVITLDEKKELSSGDGTTSNPYVVENGAYELKVLSSGKNGGMYFSYTASSSGKVTISSAAVNKLAMNEIDPYLGFIGETDDLPNFSLAGADVSGNKDSKIDINFSFTFDAVEGKTYYFLVFVTSATSFPATFNIYIK